MINGANKAVFYQFQIENTTFQGFVVAIALLDLRSVRSSVVAWPTGLDARRSWSSRPSLL